MPETKSERRVTCPLCLISGQAVVVNGADNRRYYLCKNCSLIFVDSCHHISPEEEKKRYATHENNIENEGYVKFLKRVLHPMLSYLDNRMLGLDYGCGPGPTLSQLVRQQGIACDDYDPFFAINPIRPPYDFIFSTECFEHFHNPEKDIRRIYSLLKPGGLLGIMTDRWTTLEKFDKWYYTKDPTHVSFYHANTFNYICNRYGFTPLWQDDNRVNLFRRIRR
ncbi:MAG: class I SAM-dependent methyltransferase [Thermodesulfobacteriota bacterium]|nr:class I SAM-dependent methyltransferase [Thermodesulfobacteriota bacterium]